MNILSKVPNTVYRLLRYAIVGSLGTWIDIFIVYLLVIGLQYPLFLGTAIAFITAATNNFLLNKIWTFGDVAGKYRRQYIKFLIVSTLWLWLTLVLMWLFVNILFISILWAKLWTSWIVLSWNFLANKYWTFASKLSLRYKHTGKYYPMFLTIIIPAYNESKRIEATLDMITSWKDNSAYSDRVEVIVVNDGSTDDTSRVVRGHRLWATLIEWEVNQGKWAAIAQWVMIANGKYSLIFDADGSTPIREIEHFLPFIDHYDVMIWSRYSVTSNLVKKQSIFRRIVSRIWAFMVQWILLDDITDTQCGFKLFDTDKGRSIFKKQKIFRWWFDIEMLFLAHSYGFSIKEIWVEWSDSPGSRFRAFRDSVRTFYELMAIKFFVWVGGYN